MSIVRSQMAPPLEWRLREKPVTEWTDVSKGSPTGGNARDWADNTALPRAVKRYGSNPRSGGRPEARLVYPGARGYRSRLARSHGCGTSQTPVRRPLRGRRGRPRRGVRWRRRWVGGHHRGHRRPRPAGHGLLPRRLGCAGPGAPGRPGRGGAARRCDAGSRAGPYDRRPDPALPRGTAVRSTRFGGVSPWSTSAPSSRAGTRRGVGGGARGGRADRPDGDRGGGNGPRADPRRGPRSGPGGGPARPVGAPLPAELAPGR